MYRVEYTEKAVKAIKKLDRRIAVLIYSWIEKNLQGCDDPRARGKALVGNRKNQWHYRIGDYRLLADIQDEKVVILILEVGHRKDIYESR